MVKKEKTIEKIITKRDIDAIERKGLGKEDTKKLIAQANRLDELMAKQQKGSTYLEKKLCIGKTTIQNYRKGINFISESVIGSLSKEFGVSEDYLRGNADVQKIENEEINKLLGLNDKSIENLSFLKNKECLNLLFDNDDLEIQFLLDESKKYIRLSRDLKEFEESHQDDDRLEYNNEYFELYKQVQLASFNMSQAYIRLISNNIK